MTASLSSESWPTKRRLPEWEIARRAGSGLFGPHLFDQYSHFAPAPAAVFALSVDRKFSPHIATVRGGGWIASGEPNPDRMPQPVWPAGLKYLPCEGAGEGKVCSCDGSFRAFALAPSGATGVAQSVQAPGLLRSRAASMKLLLR